jgi:hypothetical protein
MVPASSSGSNWNVPKLPPICFGVRRYILTGNISGNLLVAHRLNLRSKGRRQSLDISQPQYHQPGLVVSAVKDDRELLSAVAAGLVHPVVWVPSLAPLDL